MYKDFCKVFINLPFILYMIIVLFLSCFIGLSMIWSRIIIQIILLLGIGICLSLDKKRFNIIGMFLLTINLVYNISTGYYDSLTNLKFDTLKSSIYLAVGITIYYLLIFLLNNLRFKKKKEEMIKKVILRE